MAVKDKLVTLEDLKAMYDEIKGEIDNMGSVSTESLTLISSVATDSASVTKCGNIVQIDIQGLRLNGTSLASGTTLCTIPAGYRPKAKVVISFMLTSSNGVLLLVDTDGTIKNNGPMNTSLNISANYHEFYYCA